MQLLQENQPFPLSALELKGIMLKDRSSDNFDVKERKSSDASLLRMNPVASGDNVATGLNSAHKLKEAPPPLVPCCEGKELQIQEDLVRIGLSAISVKHDSVMHSVSMSQACERLAVPPGVVKHRNSFRSLHKPDLKRVPYLRRMSPEELETLFLGYAELCATARNNNSLPSVMKPPDENKQTRDLEEEEATHQEEGAVNSLHPILETRSGAEDVPVGMRLHGATARLYTSVPAGSKGCDQTVLQATNDGLTPLFKDDPRRDDEVVLDEDLHIILSPRCDEITAESIITTTSKMYSIN